MVLVDVHRLGGQDHGEEGVEARLLRCAAAVVAVRDEELLALEGGEQPVALGRIGEDVDAVLVTVGVRKRTISLTASRTAASSSGAASMTALGRWPRARITSA
jgi:hypothetical protein